MPTTNAVFTGAAVAVPAWEQWRRVFFSSGNWVIGTSWNIAGAGLLEGNFTLGKGNLQTIYNALLTLANRVYVGNGTYLSFSENDDPTSWEEQNPGAGTIPLLSQYGGQDQVYGLASFQGRLAVLLRRSVQIWVIDADPANFSRAQVLANLGTMAPLSVQSIGDLDVMFLDDSGIRSLRVRDSSLNAYPIDLGTPVDLLVQASMRTYTPSTACSIVEPSTGLYWLALGPLIYVLSFYPTSKISAWATFVPQYNANTVATFSPSTYDAGSDTSMGTNAPAVGTLCYWSKGAHDTGITDSVNSFRLTESGYFVYGGHTIVYEGIGGQSVTAVTTFIVPTTFTPTKFVVYNGQVYARSSTDRILLYGGVDNNTYDQSVVTVQTPWLDDKTPATNKVSQGINAVLYGNWTLSASMNPATADFREVVTHGSTTSPSEAVDSVFDLGRIPFEAIGTHFALKAVSSGWTKCILSSLIFHYNRAESQ